MWAVHCGLRETWHKISGTEPPHFRCKRDLSVDLPESDWRERPPEGARVCGLCEDFLRADVRNGIRDTAG